jgi:hypothetical protein
MKNKYFLNVIITDLVDEGKHFGAPVVTLHKEKRERNRNI